MKIEEFSNRRPAAKFDKLGDYYEGAITEQPELMPDKFGSPGDKVLILVLDETKLFARRQMLDAIADALREADVEEIECGGWLRVEYVAEKPTGVGSNPMKMYAAQYVPPSQLGRATVGAEDDAWGEPA